LCKNIPSVENKNTARFKNWPTTTVFSDTDTLNPKLLPSSSTAIILSLYSPDVEKIEHPSTTVDIRFGLSVSVGEDSILVGAPLNDNSNAIDTGAVYIFYFPLGTAPSPQPTLSLSPSRRPNDETDSPTLKPTITQLPTTNPTSSQRPTITHNPTQFQDGTSTAEDNVSFDNFGFSVSVSGNTVIIGAPGKDAATGLTGSAYLFSKNGLVTIDKLVAPDGSMAGDRFGHSVAASGDTVIVGAPEYDSGKGAAFLFSTDGTFLEKLLATDGTADDRFGFHVAISGTTAVIGASGAEAVYVYITTEMSEMVRIEAPTDDKVTFGWSVGVSENAGLIVVGKPISSTFDSITGVVYLYTIGGTYESLEYNSVLMPTDSSSRGFGHSVSISDNTIAIGAPNGITKSVYSFSTNGDFVGKMDNDVMFYTFGHSVSVSNDKIAVGAINQFGNNVEATYLYTRSGVLVEKITVSDSANLDLFGSSVSLDENTLVVGAPGHDNVDAVDGGETHFFHVP